MPETNAAPDALADRTADRLASLEHALAALDRLRARHTTLDGSVTAVVDGHGALVELRLSESITRRPAQQVGPVIADTCRQAAAAASAQRDRIVTRLHEELTATVVLPTGRSG